MYEFLKKGKELVKKPKILMAIGILGIVLIFISSLTGTKKSSTKAEGMSTEEYKNEVTKSVAKIVTGITGDKSPTVVVTLESGVRYSYADTGEENTTNTSTGNTAQNSEVKKRSYITVKEADGGEKALLITETMPQIRGVAIICTNGTDDTVSEKIKNAVKAALNITEKRVYVSGGNYNEKG